MREIIGGKFLINGDQREFNPKREITKSEIRRRAISAERVLEK